MNPKEFALHPTICPLPWTGVYVEPNGNVRNCAISFESLGNLHNQTIESCLHSDTNKQIKQDMINKIPHSRCSTCYKVDALSPNRLSNESNRSWYKKYGIKETDMSIYNDPTAFNLSVLDLRWRNTCNQACVYCGPDLSSKWAQELQNYTWTIDDATLEKNKEFIF